MATSEFSFILKPSPIGGVGVFATHDIAEESLLFCHPFHICVALTKDIPDALLPYCIYLNNNEVLRPERFDRMEIGWYINHSFQPNIALAMPTPDLKDRSMYALKKITAGEEILINYNDLNEPHNLKENYYKK